MFEPKMSFIFLFQTEMGTFMVKIIFMEDFAFTPNSTELYFESNS